MRAALTALPLHLARHPNLVAGVDIEAFELGVALQGLYVLGLACARGWAVGLS